MDYELIWWIAAVIISVVSIALMIAKYDRPKYDDDPYRYCPKENS